jgi:hypothetical protein
MKFTWQIPVGDITPSELQTIDAIREMAVALERLLRDRPSSPPRANGFRLVVTMRLILS